MVINIATKVPIRMVEMIGIHDNMIVDKIIAIETKMEILEMKKKRKKESNKQLKIA